MGYIWAVVLIIVTMGKGIAFDGVDDIASMLKPFMKEHGSEFLGPYTSDRSMSEIKTQNGKQRLRGLY